MLHLDYIIRFFESVPDSALPARCGMIKLDRQGIDCHIATCLNYRNNPHFMPYYERLVEAGANVKEKLNTK